MKRARRWTDGAALFVAIGLLATAGCTATNGAIGDFAMDFARQLLAAWVL